MTHLALAPPGAELLRFTRMTGSSIAALDAASWVTDFLNAAYYRRPAGDRDVDDLRLASCILTTYWYRKPPHHRLRLADLRAFHRAFGRERFAAAGHSRGTLSRNGLLEGAGRLLGDWFAAAYADDDRRGWGIAFQSSQARDAYDPACRMSLADIGRLTPEQAAPAEQVWHTYPAVEMPSASAVVAALTAPHTWPDFASELGRFTPLRVGGLTGRASRSRSRPAQTPAGRSSPAGTSRSRGSSRPRTPRGSQAGSPRSRTASPATATTSRAPSRRARRRSWAST